jgi:hypothetical protein
MKLGSNNISSIYLGGNAVQSVYLGSDLVWGGSDPDYQAVLDYATLQGYTLPSAGQQALQNQLVVDLKAAGVWSKLDTFAVFATDGNSDFALIDWIRLTQYTAVNSPTFTTNVGFSGNGTSAYIDTNYNPNTQGVNYTLNNASRIMHLKSPGGVDNTYPESSGGLRINVTGNRISFTRNHLNAGTNASVLAPPLNWSNQTSGVLRQIHRTSPTDITFIADTTVVSTTQTSTSINNANQFILRGNSAFADSNNTFALYLMGASLVAENSDFNTAWYNYYNAL